MHQAEELGATKSVIDPDKLKSLMEKGVKIKGIKHIRYIAIGEAK
jgi:hypothetical protein